MIIDNFNFFGMIFLPDKTNPPLIVDSDAPLSMPFPPQGFQSVRRRQAEVFNFNCCIQGVELHKSPLLNIARKLAGAFSAEYFLRFTASKRFNHSFIVNTLFTIVKNELSQKIMGHMR